MAFDGTTVAALAFEIDRALAGGRIHKIIQPEKDELLLTVRANGEARRLLLSASPSLPLLALDAPALTAPQTAPAFCMLLRKHLMGAKITRVFQPGLERTVHITCEHLNELQDVTQKTLIIECMGKHSNILLVDNENQIIDAIRRVGASVSSVREVLPGRPYFLPNTREKKNPLTEDAAGFREAIRGQDGRLSQAILSAYAGISPLMAGECCAAAGVDAETISSRLKDAEWDALFSAFNAVMRRVIRRDFQPLIYYEHNRPAEFAAFPLALYADAVPRFLPAMSEVVLTFFSEKEKKARLEQKSMDLRHLLHTHISRACKKENLQKAQLKNTEKRETLRLWGELLTAYAYEVPKGAPEITLINYATNEPVTIPLDKQKSATQNAKRYFDRYAKLKRTFAAVTKQLEETRADIFYLESVAKALTFCETEADLAEIREELKEAGYIKKKGPRKKEKSEKAKPLHFRSSNGFDMYVGKNNVQNEAITFHLANGNDWWFHAKEAPGSHVIVKGKAGTALPDATFEEAARLAAHFSENELSEKAEVDYVQRKHLKKPNGAKPGFVIYHTNYSMTAGTDISGIQKIEDA